MSYKKLTILNIVLVFLISFLSHFMYDFLPNNLTAVFFPTNESIFEHLKMAFTTYIIVLIIDYIILKLKKEKFDNLVISVFISAITTVILLAIIYPIIFNAIGENMFITLIVYLITIIIGNIFGYKTLKTKNLHLQETGIISFIIIVIIFGLLTFCPLKVKTYFYDYANNHYGIK